MRAEKVIEQHIEDNARRAPMGAGEQCSQFVMHRVAICQYVDRTMSAHALSHARMKLVTGERPLDQIARDVPDEAVLIGLCQQCMGEIVQCGPYQPAARMARAALKVTTSITISGMMASSVRAAPWNCQAISRAGATIPMSTPPVVSSVGFRAIAP